MTRGPTPASLSASLTERLVSAQRWLVLTGSGVSAASGVPTFRDAQTGLWAKYDAESLATPRAFTENPTLVWDWYEWRRSLIARAAPNPAHFALAELASLKPALTLVTQNVDGLHQRAGSDSVIEFHGNVIRNRCFECSVVAESEPATDTRPPACSHCDGLLRPDVVWFGEPIPQKALEAATAAASAAEVFLSVGTAAAVYPAAGLAQAAVAAGATIVEINPERTPLSATADYVLGGSAASWLPEIAAAVRKGVS
ncbi:MAG: NAD-dependent protein deacylase [Gammaproteobacteria bacterium]|nr:NAD-dependent protein deacylase [Gammaproteobacteria bacterium]